MPGVFLFKVVSLQNNGWIKLHRKMTEWGWYQNIPVKVLFLHLLLIANHKEKKWQGITIKRGQVVTGRMKLASETGLSQQQIRTALKKLTDAHVINQQTTNKNTVITICKYDKYQILENEVNQQSTNNQPTNNQQITTTKNEKNEKKKTFARFWELYPKKVSKKKSEEAWLKLNIEDHGRAINALPSHINSQQWKEGYIPHASTWLNQRRFDDEITMTPNRDNDSFDRWVD